MLTAIKRSCIHSSAITSSRMSRNGVLQCTSKVTAKGKTHSGFSYSIVYSITETAKANNLKPYDYFEYLLTEILKHMDDTDRSFLEDLLLWSPKISGQLQITLKRNASSATAERLFHF